MNHNSWTCLSVVSTPRVTGSIGDDTVLAGAPIVLGTDIYTLTIFGYASWYAVLSFDELDERGGVECHADK